jgi:hypothetical protein
VAPGRGSRPERDVARRSAFRAIGFGTIDGEAANLFLCRPMKKRLFVMRITSRAQRIGEGCFPLLLLDGRRFPVRKFDFLAVTALILVGVGGWVVSTTQARNTAPTNGTRIDALQIMTVAKDMPTDHFVDYSLVYEK